MRVSPTDNDSAKTGQQAAASMFGDGASDPPQTEEAPADTLDEFRAASMSTPAFTAERPSHLGGPRERVVPAMPARIVPVGERTIDPHAPDPRDPFAHLDLRMNPSPSDEDRNRDARKTREAKPSRESPYLSALLLAMMVLLLTMLVWMFGARVFD